MAKNIAIEFEAAFCNGVIDDISEFARKNGLGAMSGLTKGGGGFVNLFRLDMSDTTYTDLSNAIIWTSAYKGAHFKHVMFGDDIHSRTIQTGLATAFNRVCVAMSEGLITLADTEDGDNCGNKIEDLTFVEFDADTFVLSMNILRDEIAKIDKSNLSHVPFIRDVRG